MNRFSVFATRCMVALFAVGLLSVPASAAPEDYTAAAEAGRDLTTRELHTIYDAHSWLWKDGVAYFQISRRAFKAWSGAPGANANYADGRWFLPGRGKVCFRADWQTVDGSSNAVSCFAHKIGTDGTIYMHRHPHGKWFIYSRVPPHAWDESKKFLPGDHADKGYQRNKAYVDEKRAGKSCSEKGWLPVLCDLFGS